MSKILGLVGQGRVEVKNFFDAGLPGGDAFMESIGEGIMREGSVLNMYRNLGRMLVSPPPVHGLRGSNTVHYLFQFVSPLPVHGLYVVENSALSVSPGWLKDLRPDDATWSSHVRKNPKLNPSIYIYTYIYIYIYVPYTLIHWLKGHPVLFVCVEKNLR